MLQTTLWISIMWILCLRVPKRVRQIQHQLQGAQESTTLVDKGKGHQKEYNSNYSRHMFIHLAQMCACQGKVLQ
jgi:hypothetical protein